MICVYLFDPIFNEANESSPACEPGIELHVETNTPPMKTHYIQNAGHGKRLQAHCHRRDTVPGSSPSVSKKHNLATSSLKEFYDERILAGLSITFLNRADDSQDQPGNTHNGIDGKKHQTDHQPPKQAKKRDGGESIEGV